MLDQLDINIWEWFSLKWFNPVTLFSYDWQNIIYLYLLGVLPVIFILRRFLNWRFRQKITVALPDQNMHWRIISLLRYIPDFLIFGCLTCIILSLARPQKANVRIEQTSEGIDILLLLDVSKSMLVEDFKPNRLEVTKKVAIDCVRGRNYDRVGIVLFSGEAYSLSPLTNDYTMLNEYIADIYFGIVPEGGSAIGTALGVATNRMRESNTKSKVIILISDGDNTAGSLDPVTAAKLAAYYGIKIYTILVGREGEALMPKNDEEKIVVQNTIDERSLKEIAEIGDGEFFHASNDQALYQVFNRIDNYEKTQITETRYNITRDYYTIYLIWAIIFLLLWLLSKSTFISNVLED